MQKRYNLPGSGIVFSSNFASNFFDANTIVIFDANTIPWPDKLYRFCTEFLQNRCKYDANIRCNNDAFSGQIAMQIRCKFRCKYDSLARRIISFLHRIFCKTDANTMQMFDAKTMPLPDKWRCKYDSNFDANTIP